MTVFTLGMVVWNVAVICTAMSAAVAFVFRRTGPALLALSACVVLLFAGVAFVDWLAGVAS